MDTPAAITVRGGRRRGRERRRGWKVVVREMFILVPLPLGPVPLRASCGLGVFARLGALPNTRATAAGNKGTCQSLTYYLKAAFPRVGSHIFFCYRASLSAARQLHNCP